MNQFFWGENQPSIPCCDVFAAVNSEAKQKKNALFFLKYFF